MEASSQQRSCAQARQDVATANFLIKPRAMVAKGLGLRGRIAKFPPFASDRASASCYCSWHSTRSSRVCGQKSLGGVASYSHLHDRAWRPLGISTVIIQRRERCSQDELLLLLCHVIFANIFVDERRAGKVFAPWSALTLHGSCGEDQPLSSSSTFYAYSLYSTRNILSHLPGSIA